jgi:hypothetical protein
MSHATQIDHDEIEIVYDAYSTVKAEFDADGSRWGIYKLRTEEGQKISLMGLRYNTPDVIVASYLRANEPNLRLLGKS